MDEPNVFVLTKAFIHPSLKCVCVHACASMHVVRAHRAHVFDHNVCCFSREDQIGKSQCCTVDRIIAALYFGGKQKCG